MKMEATITATRDLVFQENSQPICARSPSLAIIRGTPPSSVPTGHSHLQKRRGHHAVDHEKVQRQADDHHHQHYVLYKRQAARPSILFELFNTRSSVSS